MFFIVTVYGYSQILIDYGPLTGNSKYNVGDSKWNKNVLYYYINNTSNHLTYLKGIDHGGGSCDYSKR